VVVLATVVVGLPQSPRDQPPQSQFNSQPPRRDNFGRSDYANIPILRQENDNTGDGNFKWGYETGDQQTHQAEGRFAKAYPGATGLDDTALDVKGSWSYVDGDGKRVLVEYTGKPHSFPLPTQVKIQSIQSNFDSFLTISHFTCK